jgi:D-amino-acid dehydrogenase
MALFDDLFLETPLDCDFEKKGLLTLFKDQQTFEAYEDTNAFLEKYDFGAVPLSRDETLNMEPAVGENIAGAWFNEHDWHLRPEMLVQAWKDLLVQKGVKIRENCRLLDFDTHQGKTRQVNTTQGPCTADAFVLATGAWAPRVSRQLDLNIPVQPGKGYSITMKRPEGSPRIPCTLYERNMVVTPWESGYRLGGTMEFSGFNDQLNKKRLNRLVQGAKEYLTVNTDLLVQEEWTGLRPMTYDDMPIIDRVSGRDNLFAATGHGMLGLTLATGTGKTVCDMICGEKPGIDPAPFSLNRF